MLGFLAARAIPGLEWVSDGVYGRGTATVSNDSGRGELIVTSETEVEGRVRRLFDTDTDVGNIERDLAGDPLLARLIERRPGLRVPGAWDGFELGVRAILGQQITVAAARGLAGRLVARFGEAGQFPTPERMAEADLSVIGMPKARAAALSGLAAVCMADATLFAPTGSLDEATARFRALRGVGEWTAHYMALRALRHPDAFPAGDVALQRAAAVDGARPSAAELLARADAWRPWRAYAAQHLWTSLTT